jgi:hypothetical protein
MESKLISFNAKYFHSVVWYGFPDFTKANRAEKIKLVRVDNNYEGKSQSLEITFKVVAYGECPKEVALGDVIDDYKHKVHVIHHNRTILEG